MQDSDLIVGRAPAANEPEAASAGMRPDREATFHWKNLRVVDCWLRGDRGPVGPTFRKPLATPTARPGAERPSAMRRPAPTCPAPNVRARALVLSVFEQGPVSRLVTTNRVVALRRPRAPRAAPPHGGPPMQLRPRRVGGAVDQQIDSRPPSGISRAIEARRPSRSGSYRRRAAASQRSARPASARGNADVEDDRPAALASSVPAQSLCGGSDGRHRSLGRRRPQA